MAKEFFRKIIAVYAFEAGVIFNFIAQRYLTPWRGLFNQNGA